MSCKTFCSASCQLLGVASANFQLPQNGEAIHTGRSKDQAGPKHQKSAEPKRRSQSAKPELHVKVQGISAKKGSKSSWKSNPSPGQRQDQGGWAGPRKLQAVDVNMRVMLTSTCCLPSELRMSCKTFCSASCQLLGVASANFQLPQNGEAIHTGRSKDQAGPKHQKSAEPKRRSQSAKPELHVKVQGISAKKGSKSSWKSNPSNSGRATRAKCN